MTKRVIEIISEERVIDSREMCIFEHALFPHCCISHKNKKRWCRPAAYSIKLKDFYAPPPRWCKLRKGAITVRLRENKKRKSRKAVRK